MAEQADRVAVVVKCRSAGNLGGADLVGASTARLEVQICRRLDLVKVSGPHGRGRNRDVAARLNGPIAWGPAIALCRPA